MKTIRFLFLLIISFLCPITIYAQAIDQANMVLWLRADTISAGTTDVLNWLDKSPTFNNALQVSNVDAPQFISSIQKLNNKPVVRFDGMTDFLSLTSPLPLQTGVQGVSIFAVIIPDVSGRDGSYSGGGLLRQYPGGDAAGSWGVGIRSDRTLGIIHHLNQGDNSSGISFSNTSFANLEPLIASWLWDGNQQVIAQNTTVNGLNNRSTSSGWGTGNGEIGRLFPQGSYYFKGDIAEIIVYNSSLTPLEINKIYTYFKNKYAPPVNLGSDISSTFCATEINAGKRFNSYLWSDGSTADSLVVTQSGKYWVDVIDVFGFQSSDTINVNIANAPVIANKTICAGNNTILDATITPGIYSYLWNNGETASSISVNTGGNYRCTITDAFTCTKITNTAIISIDNFASTISLGNDTNLCKGNSIGLVKGTGITSYLWNNSITTPTILINASGENFIEVQNVNGCIAKDTIQVTVVGQAPMAKFTSKSACLGDTVFLKNLSLSVGDPIITYQWDFGNSTTSNQFEDSVKYTTPGSYNIKLKVTAQSGCVAIKDTNISVFKLPQALFNDSVSCPNALAQFNDLSTFEAGNTINQWLWTFGDGQTAITPTTTHQYAFIDSTILVKLNVSDVNGCKAKYERTYRVLDSISDAGVTNLINPNENELVATSNVVFAWSPLNYASNYEVQISTSPSFTIFNSYMSTVSTKTITLTTGNYYWRVKTIDRCNIISYSLIQPFKVIDFNQNGNLTLWLRADALSTNINQVTTWQDSGPLLNSATQSNLTNASTYISSIEKLNNKPAVRFDGFDDFYLLNAALPLHTSSQSVSVFAVIIPDATGREQNYAGGGLLRQYLGNDASGSWAVGTRGDRRLAIIHHLNQGANSQGVSRINTQFENNRGLIATWLWDGSSQIIENNTLAGTLSLAPTASGWGGAGVGEVGRSYSDAQYYFKGDIAEILVFNSALNNIQKNEVYDYFRNKYAPPVNLGSDITTTTFCDVELNAGKRFMSYLWNDGSTADSLVVNKTGKYWVKAIDVFGFESTDTVNVTFPQLNKLLDKLVCKNDTALLDIGLTTTAYSFLWNTGATTPKVKAFTNGNYSAIITDANSCTKATDTASISIDNFPIIAKLGNDTSFCAGNTIKLVTGSATGLSYTWSTGATTSQIAIQNSGEYRLTVTNNNNCIVKDTIDIIIIGIAPTAKFTSTIACKSSLVTFTDQSTAPNGSNIIDRKWDFGDGSPLAMGIGPAHLFADSTVYNVQLLVSADNGCAKDTTIAIKVYPSPVVNFASSGIACDDYTTSFINLTSNFGYNTGNTYSWNFGNLASASNTSSLATPSHIYDNASSYAVKLVVQNNKGCKDSIQKNITVQPSPVAAFTTSTTLCEKQQIQFTDKTNSVSAINIYSTDFGDLTTKATIKNPTHTYTNSGAYIVKYIVVATNGCSDTISNAVIINNKPDAKFGVLSSLCAANTVNFTDSSTVNGAFINGWNWLFNNSVVSTNQNPNPSFANAGTVPVRLIATSSKGCIDTIIKNITIHPLPNPLFTATPTYGNVPLPVTLSNNTVGSNTYSWNFGDGSAGVSTVNATNTYQDTGTYTLTLKATNTFGCSQTATKTVSVLNRYVDLAVLAVTATVQNNFLTVSAIIGNMGTTDVPGFDIYASVNNSAQVKETSTSNFLIGTTQNYNFTSSVYLTDASAGEYVCVSLYTPDNFTDEKTSNNVLCIALNENQNKVLEPSPNPSNFQTTVPIILNATTPVIADLYDAKGKLVANLYNTTFDKGLQFLTIETSVLRADLYALRIKIGDKDFVKKILVAH